MCLNGRWRDVGLLANDFSYLIFMQLVAFHVLIEKVDYIVVANFINVLS